MQKAKMRASIKLLGMRNGNIALQIRPRLHLGFSRIDVLDARTHQVFRTQSALCELGGSVTCAELMERSHGGTFGF
jgi:hypothetical protein